MSVYKDFVFIGIGLVAGIYISKDENNKIKEKYDKVFYKLKPTLRDIKNNIFELLNKSNNIELDDIFINLRNSLEILKSKVDEMNQIEDLNHKLDFLKGEIFQFLSSIQIFLKKQKDQFHNYHDDDTSVFLVIEDEN